MKQAVYENNIELIYILLIESGQNKIESTFKDCKKLKQIVLPPTITEIGSKSFLNCESLCRISIPSSVTCIGDNSFENCNSLSQISIPSSVTSIGDSAFENCSYLKQVSIPCSVEKIGKNAFKRCYFLSHVLIPPSVKSIDDCAFKECSSLSQVTIPSSIESIGDHVFKKCDRLNEDSSDSDKSYKIGRKLPIGFAVLLSAYYMIFLACLFSVFIISLIWWLRIHPWLLHGYKSGKIVYLSLEICWISILCIGILFGICFLNSVIYNLYRKRIIVMKNRIRYKKFTRKLNYYVLLASVALGLISFICTFVVLYYTSNSDEKIDGKNIKCLRYILDGVEGAKIWFLNQSVKKQIEFKKWHSEMLNKAYGKDGNVTDYYCYTIRIPMLIFSCLPFAVIIIFILLYTIFACYVVIQFSLHAG